jgi:hypothetical protein
MQNYNFKLFYSNKRWDFHSEESDIGFAVYLKEGSELIPVVPPERVDCHMSAEEGEIPCDSTGVCKSTISLSTLHVFVFNI